MGRAALPIRLFLQRVVMRPRRREYVCDIFVLRDQRQKYDVCWQCMFGAPI